MFCEVLEFFGVGIVVVQLAPPLALVPFSVTPSRSPETVSVELVAIGSDIASEGAAGISAAALNLSEGPSAAGMVGVLQHGNEALSVKIFWGRNAAELGEGREEVDMRDGCRCCHALGVSG